MKKFVYLNPQEPMPCTQATATWYDSVRACSRCHACSQSCPSYLLQPQEIFSPRGRVQLLRLFLEGKITSYKQVPSLEKSIRTCVLCARCSGVCAGQVPVAHQMTAFSQAQHITLLPVCVQFLLLIRRKQPALFHGIIKMALWLHRTRLSFFFYPLLPAWLKHLYRITPFKTVPLRKTHRPHANGYTPDALYLPSLYAQYIDGIAAQKILQYSKAEHPLILWNMSSGLEYYLYESRAAALQTAKKLLLRWEQYSTKKPLPLLTDSVEMYLFVKNYPFLFQALAHWRRRAEKLAAQVRFVTDLSFPKSEKNLPENVNVLLDASTVLYPSQTVTAPALKILKTFYGKNLVECEYSRFPLPVAATSLIKGSPARKMAAAYAQDIARRHITNIYCLSGWAALELQAALKNKKTAARVVHFIHAGIDYGTLEK